MKKVLVTGSAGYIGQHLIKMLNGKYEVYGLDINPTNSNMVADIRYGNQLENYLFLLNEMPDDYDAIIHLAAKVRVGESVSMPLNYYDTNINGTINVLQYVTTKNFIFASTGAAALPTSPYAYSKVVAEHIVQEYCIKNSIDYTIFRFYNVVGADGIEPTNPDGLMFNLMKAPELGYFNLFGTDYNTPDGSAIRDYVHVNEICNALMEAIETPSGKVENLGTGVGHTVMEMIDTFKKVNQYEFEVRSFPRREGDLERSVLDNVSPYYIQSYTLEELMKV